VHEGDLRGGTAVIDVRRLLPERPATPAAIPRDAPPARRPPGARRAGRADALGRHPAVPGPGGGPDSGRPSYHPVVCATRDAGAPGVTVHPGAADLGSYRPLCWRDTASAPGRCPMARAAARPSCRSQRSRR